jgi:hypothetical protein
MIAMPFWRSRQKLSLITCADQAMRARKWRLAAELYLEVLRRTPTRAAIWVQYGHALKEAGDLAEAESAYKRSLYIAPGNADTHLQLGHVLKLQDKKQEAQAAYLNAAAIDPSLRYPLQELANLGWSPAHLSELETQVASGNATMLGDAGTELETQVASGNAMTLGDAGTELDMSGGPDLATLVNSSAATPEVHADNIKELVQNAYRGVLKRDAEPRGIELYGNALRNGMSQADLIAQLIDTPEFRSLGLIAALNESQTTEFRRLASSIERAMLTLAITGAQRGNAKWPVGEFAASQTSVAEPTEGNFATQQRSHAP